MSKQKSETLISDHIAKPKQNRPSNTHRTLHRSSATSQSQSQHLTRTSRCLIRNRLLIHVAIRLFELVVGQHISSENRRRVHFARSVADFAQRRLDVKSVDGRRLSEQHIIALRVLRRLAFLNFSRRRQIVFIAQQQKGKLFGALSARLLQEIAFPPM